METTKYKRGEHPDSKNNLNFHSGRPYTYQEPKKQRYLSVTETGWEQVQRLAQDLGCSGVSDLLEKIARGEILLEKHNGE